MRSGKRSGDSGPWAPAPSWGVEQADLGIGVEPLSDLVLRRVSRQSGGRGGRSGGWGGGHMLRTGATLVLLYWVVLLVTYGESASCFI